MTPEEIKAALDSKFKALQDDLQAAQAEGVSSKNEILKLHEEIKESGQAIEDFIESQKKQTSKTVKQQLNSFLKEKESEIEEIRKAGTGYIDFVPKVVGDITTGSGVDEAPEMSPVGHTQLGSFNLRNDERLLNMATISSTGSSTTSYTELIPKDGDYTFVAEGAEKPQIDFKWENRFPRPYKIAAHEVLTEESVTDVARLQSVANEYLTKKHGLFKAANAYFGDGTGENAKGATEYGRTFVAGDMANQVVNPNFMDVVNACITDIYTTKNYVDEAQYMANVCLINPVDFFIQLVSAKDERGLPLYPQAGLFNQVTIGGVTILPWDKIPAGKIFVADMKMMNIVNYIPFSIRIGWINDQFITNMFTMVGESRYFQYVKKLDEQAFIYDDLETVKASIASITPA
jgi:HK97 family phage major capsid protein